MAEDMIGWLYSFSFMMIWLYRRDIAVGEESLALSSHGLLPSCSVILLLCWSVSDFADHCVNHSFIHRCFLRYLRLPKFQTFPSSMGNKDTVRFSFRPFLLCSINVVRVLLLSRRVREVEFLEVPCSECGTKFVSFSVSRSSGNWVVERVIRIYNLFLQFRKNPQTFWKLRFFWNISFQKEISFDLQPLNEEEEGISTHRMGGVSILSTSCSGGTAAVTDITFKMKAPGSIPSRASHIKIVTNQTP